MNRQQVSAALAWAQRRQRWEQGRALRFPADEADLYRRFVVRQSTATG
jgi:hypothetical protein